MENPIFGNFTTLYDTIPVCNNYTVDAGYKHIVGNCLNVLITGVTAQIIPPYSNIPGYIMS